MVLVSAGMTWHDLVLFLGGLSFSTTGMVGGKQRKDRWRRQREYICLMGVSFQPIKLTGSWMNRTGSCKEATLYQTDILTKISQK